MALPLGELSAKLTERVYAPGNATFPKRKVKWRPSVDSPLRTDRRYHIMIRGSGILKEKSTKAKEIIMTILFMPVALFFSFWLLIITPFDYFQYKRTRFYKDTREKYAWLCMKSDYIKLYDLIKNANLPIDYYRCKDVPVTGYGYFVYKDTLILNDYEPFFDEEKNTWMVEIEDAYIDIKDDVQNTVDSCNALLKKAVCTKAILLIDSELYNEHPDVTYDLFDFAPVCDDDTLAVLTEILK